MNQSDYIALAAFGVSILSLWITLVVGCSMENQDVEYWLQYHSSDGYWEYSAGATGTKAECENHLVRYGKPTEKYVKVTCAPRPKGTKGVW